MPIIFILIGLAFAVASVLFFASEKWWDLTGCAIAVVLCLTAWLVAVGNTPYRYENETVLTPQVVDGVAVVIYRGRLYNMNDTLDRQIGPEDKIVAKTVVQGPYKGVYIANSEPIFELKE